MTVDHENGAGNGASDLEQLVHLHPRTEVRTIEELRAARARWPENLGRNVARAEVLREIVSAGLPVVVERQRARAQLDGDSPAVTPGDH